MSTGEAPAEALTPLRDITDIEPMSGDDAACVEALRKVLYEFRAQTRFGITLLHEHFPLNHGEILVEEIDVENRTLTTRPKLEAEIPTEDRVATSWRLDSSDGGTALAHCRAVSYCISRDPTTGVPVPHWEVRGHK
jgi:hypothetical protein